MQRRTSRCGNVPIQAAGQGDKLITQAPQLVNGLPGRAGRNKVSNGMAETRQRVERQRSQPLC